MSAEEARRARYAALALLLVSLAALAWALKPAPRTAAVASVIRVAEDGGRLEWHTRYGQYKAPLGAAPLGGWRGLLLGEPLNLNRADAVDLKALPGVGPKTAQKILEARAAKDGFGSVDELAGVPGIGKAKLEKMRGWVTLPKAASN